MLEWLLGRNRKKTERDATGTRAEAAEGAGVAEGQDAAAGSPSGAESDERAKPPEGMNSPYGVELVGRTVRRVVPPVVGATILDLAERNGVDWRSHCKKGTCARCRCHVRTGQALLTEPSEAELDRLGEDEIAQGYRLGCQAKIAKEGPISVKHASYFP